jgi:hypothetical protein
MAMLTLPERLTQRRLEKVPAERMRVENFVGLAGHHPPLSGEAAAEVDEVSEIGRGIGR